MTHLLTLEDLRKSYGTGETATEVLRGVDLTLDQGEFTALLGPSGSGKSTLLSILGTLLRPTSGRHLMLGQDLGQISDSARADFRNRHLGFVFQFHHLLPDFSALENVVFPAALHAGRERAADLDRAAMLLDRVGLSHRRDFRTGQLSGGQKQRVAIARALMNAPNLVLADEPTGSLDVESADLVMELLAEMNREEKICFLISTHDPRMASRCRRRVMLQSGRVVPEGQATA